MNKMAKIWIRKSINKIIIMAYGAVEKNNRQFVISQSTASDPLVDIPNIAGYGSRNPGIPIPITAVG